jgi:hypothetical protein
MATDNRTDQLFPDVTEHYGDDVTDTTGDVDFPVPQEHYEPESFTPALYSGVVLPVVPVTPATPDDSSDVATYHEDPTDEFSVVIPVEAAAKVAPPADTDDDRHMVEAAAHVEYTTTDDVAEFESDPYAGAPDWVRAHIPRGPLVAEVQVRRGVSVRLPRRPARASAQSADVPAEVAVTEPKTPERPQSDSAREIPDNRKNYWLIGGAAAAVVAVIAGTVAVFASSDDAGDLAVPPLPSSTQAAENTAAPGEETWCPDSTKNGKIIGRGPGDLTTGPGLIQAFDYAYYVERDAAKVTSMYVNPNPVGPIQASIDAAAALGTEHCLTIEPTANPNVFDVQLRLRTEAGSEGADRQRITVADSGSGLRIATLEEIQ